MLLNTFNFSIFNALKGVYFSRSRCITLSTNKVCLKVYKLSQDHLELFFSAVRAAGDSKIIQQHSNLWQSTRGCSSCRSTIKRLGDNTTILDIAGDSCKTSRGKTVTISHEAALIRKYDLQERPPAQTDHDLCNVPNIVVLSENESAAIYFLQLLAMWPTWQKKRSYAFSVQVH